MLRLCSDSSRTLSGEACPTGRLRSLKAAPCMATCRVIGQESAEAIVGAGRRPQAMGRLETSPA